MILYVNGDSHSVGVGADKNFAQHLANRFNLTLVNQASVGASNQKIIRTTREYLKNNTPALVVIGWSTWEREEWLHEGQYYNVNSSGSESLPKDLEEQYKTWVSEQNADLVDIKSQYCHQEIYKLHQDLEIKNVPHVFFNCMYNFFSIQKQLDWNNKYLGPYDNNSSYYWYLKNHGYKTDKWYHYGADGHQIWADVLINYIESNKII